MTTLGGLAQLMQLVHLLPPLVGIVLVVGSKARGPWRAWALAFFGLSILGTLGSTLWVLLLTRSGVGGHYGRLAVAQGGFGLLSLLAAGCAVAAVLVGREASAPPAR